MAKPVVNARIPEEMYANLNLHMQSAGRSQTEVMVDALAQYLSASAFPPVTPTEDQRSGMRSRALTLMQTGREYSPAEAGRLMGCGECAASAYFRDLRKGKYGGHNIISRPEIVEGRRVSFYRMEAQL